MEYKAQHQHNFIILCLLLLTTSFPSNMANYNKNLPTNGGNPNGNTKDTYDTDTPAPDAPKEGQNEKGPQLNEENYKQCVADCECQCPSVCECPLSLEPGDFKQLKKNLAPVIHQRLRELFNKVLTVESAIEVAHTIDLLKLIKESTSELNLILDNMHMQGCSAS